ncbi:MAG: hypothetical protein COB20_07280 [SAR86 cluster bacterium]|uniref:Flippase-like domain-containing protein n=1 Tax=SAR86 cluster bacterium TaxID=2030880 RepID=A0A2A4X4V8_9GAMM|nr:MAG: hypothetical protein COB20_07280 [SAR86 cluster bacterium]
MSEETENNSETTTETEVEVAPGKKKPSPIGRVLFLILTALCFAYLYYRLNGAAAREGLSLVEYMTQVFATVNWIPWLALMVCYSLFYFAIDTLVVTKALNWFVADIKYKDIMPIRASAYIISIFNEQIGKGAMAYYLNKRDQIPGWEVGSVMLFVMFCEIYYLLVWATIGFAVGGDSLPEVFGLVPYIAAIATVFLVLWIAYFRGVILPNNKFREKAVLHAFRQAKPWHYGAFFLLRSPALMAAIVVYTVALNLFGVEASLMTLLPFLPVIFFAAAVPTPMRAAAITFWVILFPENEGQMAAFGFVQHNFFILFNAAIGLVFWRKAQRDLFGK